MTYTLYGSTLIPHAIFIEKNERWFIILGSSVSELSCRPAIALTKLNAKIFPRSRRIAENIEA